MDKHMEAVKEILEDQMKKIAKKGDITPQELDSLYKASAICLDFETKEAMKKAEKEQGSQSNDGGASQRGSYSQRGGSYGGSYDGGSNRGYANDGYANEGNSNRGYSTHYPWFMYGYGRDGGGMSNRGSYGMEPDWNEGTAMGEMHSQRGGSYDGNSNRGSYARGSYDDSSNRNSNDGMSNENSNRRGSYGRSNDGSYDEGSSYRRGRNTRTGRYMSRDGGSYDYSRDEEKDHMLDRLESMLDNASTEKDRRAIEQCIDRISR